MARMDRGQRKKLRKVVEAGKANRNQLLQFYGESCLAGVELLSLPSSLPAAAPLRLRDVQNVLLWALTEDVGDMPKWLSVRNKPLIRGCLLAMAPGLGAQSAEHLGVGHLCLTEPRSFELPRAHQSHLLSTAASELLQVRVPKKRKAALLAAAESQTTSSHPGRHPKGGWRLAHVRSFCLSTNELRQNGYPLQDAPHLCATACASMRLSWARPTRTPSR